MSYSNKEKAEIYDALETIDNLNLNDISVNCHNNNSYIMGKSLILQDKFFKEYA